VALEPFLKWAGGKRWLVSRYGHLFPHFEGRYIEPFLGGGAVFFHLMPKVAFLSDKNADLITTYRALRDMPATAHRKLCDFQKLHSREFYYATRQANPRTSIARACRFLYLNRVCFNGLYRVNQKGVFNVPLGTKSEVEYPEGYLSSVGKALQGATITQADFELAIDESRRGDFVFLDPPYTVAHNHNGFIKYNDVLFTWDDQQRLARAALRAARRGSFVFVANADHEAVRALYPEFNAHTLHRLSTLAADSATRRKTTEAAFLNYPTAPSPI
jgi:DNA adenine methylase